MTERKIQILNHIIEDYIKTAKAIGSDYLVDKYKLGMSSATVRNIMAELESEGLLVSPHTSAGRIPTEKAYRQYLDSRLKPPAQDGLRFGGIKDLSPDGNKTLIKKDSLTLDQAYKINGNGDIRYKKKNLAKALAELSQTAVLIGFDKRDIYYTGLSYLFNQPEFQSLELVYNIGAVVDHLDEVLADIYDEIDEEVEVKIGSENPFSSDCSFISTKLPSKELFGMLGPTRMEYIENIQRLEYAKQLLSG